MAMFLLLMILQEIIPGPPVVAEINVEPVRILTGLQGSLTLPDGTVIVKEGAEPAYADAGLVEGIETGASVLALKDGKPVPISKVSEGQFLVTATGDVLLVVTTLNVDFDSRTSSLDQSYKMILIPGQEPIPPPEPPQPPPDPVDPVIVPEDEFDNLGQRVAAWASGLPSNSLFAECYSNAAKTLESDPRATADSVAAQLEQCMDGVAGAQAYKDFFTKLNEDLIPRWGDAGFAKQTVVNYWRAVAAGLRGAK